MKGEEEERRKKKKTFETCQGTDKAVEHED